MGIHQKILEVQKAVGYIKKNGKNTFHKYDYAMEADVLEVKRIMNEHGLIAYPSLVGYQTQQRGDTVQVFQEIEYTVVDAESKEEVKCRVLGSGEDKGDKGTYKGSTGANKYFYLKFFGVSTGDDPEADEQPKPVSQKPVRNVLATKGELEQVDADFEEQKKQEARAREARELAKEISQGAKARNMTPEMVRKACQITCSLQDLANASNIEALRAARECFVTYLKGEPKNAGNQ